MQGGTWEQLGHTSHSSQGLKPRPLPVQLPARPLPQQPPLQIRFCLVTPSEEMLPPPSPSAVP